MFFKTKHRFGTAFRALSVYIFPSNNCKNFSMFGDEFSMCLDVDIFRFVYNNNVACHVTRVN